MTLSVVTAVEKAADEMSDGFVVNLSEVISNNFVVVVFGVIVELDSVPLVSAQNTAQSTHSILQEQLLCLILRQPPQVTQVTS